MNSTERQNSIFEAVVCTFITLSELRDVYRAEFYAIEKENMSAEDYEKARHDVFYEMIISRIEDENLVNLFVKLYKNEIKIKWRV